MFVSMSLVTGTKSPTIQYHISQGVIQEVKWIERTAWQPIPYCTYIKLVLHYVPPQWLLYVAF